MSVHDPHFIELAYSDPDTGAYIEVDATNPLADLLVRSNDWVDERSLALELHLIDAVGYTANHLEEHGQLCWNDASKDVRGTAQYWVAGQWRAEDHSWQWGWACDGGKEAASLRPAIVDELTSSEFPIFRARTILADDEAAFALTKLVAFSIKQPGTCNLSAAVDDCPGNGKQTFIAYSEPHWGTSI